MRKNVDFRLKFLPSLRGTKIFQESLNPNKKRKFLKFRLIKTEIPVLSFQFLQFFVFQQVLILNNFLN